jgi:hypothetical protein
MAATAVAAATAAIAGSLLLPCGYCSLAATAATAATADLVPLTPSAGNPSP